MSSAPVVVRIAATPAEAQVVAALLRSEGIRAHVEGLSLVDDFVGSRRMTNVQRIRVVVPAASILRARAVLERATIDDDELTAQALAERLDDDGPSLAPVFRIPTRRRRARVVTWTLVLLAAAGALLAWLW